MAFLEDELFRMVTADTDLSALIGTRFWPEGYTDRITTPLQLPYVIRRQITATFPYEHGGKIPLHSVLFQFDCYADRPDSARSVAVALQAALDSWSSPQISRAFIRDDQAGFEDDTRLYFRSVDAEIWTSLL